MVTKNTEKSIFFTFISFLSHAFEFKHIINAFSSKKKDVTEYPKFAILFNIYELVNANTIETVDAVITMFNNKNFEDNYLLDVSGFFDKYGNPCNTKKKARKIELYHYIMVLYNPRYGDKAFYAMTAVVKMCGIKNMHIVQFDQSMLKHL